LLNKSSNAAATSSVFFESEVVVSTTGSLLVSVESVCFGASVSCDVD